MPQPQPGVVAQAHLNFGKGFAIRLGEQAQVGGRLRENAFVEAEDHGELEVRIAGAIHRADEHLIHRRGNHADGQRAEARFEDRQPLAQRQGKRAERVFQVVEQTAEFVEHGEMCHLVRRRGGPVFQRRSHFKIIPQPAERPGKLPAIRLVAEGVAQSLERRDDPAAQLFAIVAEGGIIGEGERLQPLAALPAAGERDVFQPIDLVRT